MEDVLNDVVSPSDLKKFEEHYNEERGHGKVSYDCQFQYALCLVRSQYPADIQRGIHLLEDLFTNNPEGRRDYLYFLAIGNARLKKYTKALKLLRAFEEIEPNNPQVETLITTVKKKLENEGRRGLLAAGGGLLALGVAVGAGFLIAKSK